MRKKSRKARPKTREQKANMQAENRAMISHKTIWGKHAKNALRPKNTRKIQVFVSKAKNLIGFVWLKN